jgi:hypothetical protein
MASRYLYSALIFFAVSCTQDEPLERSTLASKDGKATKEKNNSSGECFNLVIDGHRTALERTDDSLLVLGDIVLGRVNDSEVKDSYGLSNTILENFPIAGGTWTNGVVPYTFSAAATNPFKTAVVNALNSMKAQGIDPITFVVRTNEDNYVEFNPTTTGNSNSLLGMVGGKQAINLLTGWSTSTFYHEMMHALGVWHEQQRWDRDDYLTVTEANIPAALKSNVDKVFGDTSAAFDFDSIMLYDSCGGLTPQGCTNPWYVRKSNNTQIRQPQIMSAQDKSALKTLYAPKDAVIAIDHLLPHYKLFSTQTAPFVIQAKEEDTKVTVAAYLYDGGQWSVRDRTDIPTFKHGGEGDVPVPGNYYGDDADEAAVFKPNIRKWVAGEQVYTWPVEAITGKLIPVPFHYSSGRYLDLAVFNRDDGMWHIKGQEPFKWSVTPSEDQPVPANYGDARGKIATFNAKKAEYAFFKNKAKLVLGKGSDKLVPFAGDLDLDGIEDPAAYNFSSGVIVYESSKTGKIMQAASKMANHLPIARKFEMTGAVKFKLMDQTLVLKDFDLATNATVLESNSASTGNGNSDDYDSDESNSDDKKSASSSKTKKKKMSIEKGNCLY